MKQLEIGRKYAFKTKWGLFLYGKVNAYLVNNVDFRLYFSVEMRDDGEYLMNYEDGAIFDSVDKCEKAMMKYIEDNFNTVDKRYWDEIEAEREAKRKEKFENKEDAELEDEE